MLRIRARVRGMRCHTVTKVKARTALDNTEADKLIRIRVRVRAKVSVRVRAVSGSGLGLVP